MSLFRLVARVGCLRDGATRLLEEWPHRRSNALDRTRLTGPLALLFPCEGRGPVFLHRDWAPAFAGAQTSSIEARNGEAEEIERLGLSALACIRSGRARRVPGAAVRPRGLQR